MGGLYFSSHFHLAYSRGIYLVVNHVIIKKKSNLKYILKTFCRRSLTKTQTEVVLFCFILTHFHFPHFSLVIKPAEITEKAGISKFEYFI